MTNPVPTAMHTASEAQVTGVARGGVGRGGAAEKVRWWERNVVGVVLVLRGRRRRVRRKEVRRAFIELGPLEYIVHRKSLGAGGCTDESK